MSLQDAPSATQSYQKREVQKLLDGTEDALAQSGTRLRQAFAGLNQAREQNAQHREQLQKFRRLIGSWPV